jgi:hypothetical protein
VHHAMPCSGSRRHGRAGWLPALLLLLTLANPAVAQLSGSSVSITPRSLGFGSLPVGVLSLPRDFTITNLSTYDLHLGYSWYGDHPQDFSMLYENSVWTTCGNTGVIPPGSTCTFTVQFRPTATGSRAAVVRLSFTAFQQFGPPLVHLEDLGLSGTSIAVLPLTPHGLTAGANSTTQIVLNWTDRSNNETGFEVQRQPPGGAWATIATLPADRTYYHDNGLTPLDPYVYRVRAFNSVGPSAYWSNAAWATTAIAPAAPSGLAVRTATNAPPRLTWADNSSNETAFAIFRKDSSGVWSRIGLVAANTTVYVDTTAAAKTTYTYRVRATNNQGASAWSNEVTVTTPAPVPAAPTGLAVSGVSSTRVNLTWTDQGSNETAFAIWRKDSSGVWSRIGVVAPNTTVYSDITVAGGKIYTYRVRATNNHGASVWSGEVGVTTPAS